MGCCLSSQGTTDDDEAEPGDNLGENLLRHIKGDVLTKYEVMRTIGKGSMGDIALARIRDDKKGGSAYSPKRKGVFGYSTRKTSSIGSHHSLSASERRGNDTLYALKTILLNRISPEFIEELKNEISILKTLDHPNIVKGHEVFTNKDQIYIVMEVLTGGDLYKRLPYTEKDACKIVGKLLSAVFYMHERNVVHRDLKLENIMFENHHEDAEVKVIDFGLSKRYSPGEGVMTEGVGTIYTMAPQVLQGVYTSMADLWSCGVIAFVLLSSQKPFYHKRRSRVIDKIMRCDYRFSRVWDEISDEAQDFCRSLLVLDPKDRLDAEQALKHKWMERDFALSDRKPSDDTMRGVENNLILYKNTSALKKVALNVIAHKSSTEEILQLRKAFDQYDTSNNGVITLPEFEYALKELNYSMDEVHSLFDSIDVNRNGVIMYTEFIAATLEVRGRIEEERIAEAFDRMDSDDDGFIGPEELRKLLGQEATPELIADLIKEADMNGDGKLSFKEFLAVFRKNTVKLADKAAQLGGDDSDQTSHELLGLDAKIPGGKFDNSE